MSWTVRAEVERVVADLVHWRRLGVVVLASTPLEGSGARVGVQHAHPLVARAMRARYVARPLSAPPARADRTFVGSIGLVAAVPITTALAAAATAGRRSAHG